MNIKSFAFCLLIVLFISSFCFSQDILQKADVDGSGRIDEQDLFLLQRYWHEEISETTEESFAPTRFSESYEPPAVDVVPSVTPYSLPRETSTLANWGEVNSFYDLSPIQPLIETNGFGVLASATGEDVIFLYEQLQSGFAPIFVTADSLLHLYHIQFDETLKAVEEEEFFDALLELTQGMLEDTEQQVGQYAGDLDEAAFRNVVYFSVALKLLDPAAEVPISASDTVAQELALIDAHEGFVLSPLFLYEEDYSQYVPRGHYTRSETLQKYFRAMMWYGRMGFLLKNSTILAAPNAEIQTLAACLITDALNRVTQEGKSALEIWDRIYAVTAFYVGVADDLTPDEYREAIQSVAGAAAEVSALADSETYEALRAYLANLRNPEIYGGTGNCVILPPFDPSQIDECLEKSKGMRFMGQRFIPDSYMFQNLVSADYLGAGQPFTWVISGAGREMRGFPRGLDAMDLLGSARAYQILVAEGDTEYLQYPEQRRELIEEFAPFTVQDWNRNLYWSWLYALKPLLCEFGSGYPTFMQSEAWTDKSLNTALASWTQLRHDTILYAKQSYTPYETGVPPVARGYVEPVPEFYARLLALTAMTREGLAQLEVLSATAEGRLTDFEAVLDKLLDLSIKELECVPLSNEEYLYIQNIADVLKDVIVGVEDLGLKTTIVADVHTEANTSQVLEESVGYVDLLAAVIPQPDGTLEIALGPVLSYYEFKQPMNDRLTDEAWRARLAEQPPERPPWTASFVR